MRLLRGLGGLLGVKDYAFELPWTPGFLQKHGGLVLSLGQFNQWVGSQLMATGLVQIWPGTPVSAPIFAGEAGKARYRSRGFAWPTRAWTARARRLLDSCREWMCTRR